MSEVFRTAAAAAAASYGDRASWEGEQFAPASKAEAETAVADGAAAPGGFPGPVAQLSLPAQDVSARTRHPPWYPDFPLTAPAEGAMELPSDKRVEGFILINGQRQPVKVLVDTGASRSAVDAELARLFRLPKIGDGSVAGSSGPARVDIVPISELTVGPIKASNVALHLANLTAGGLHILLGTDLLDKAGASVGPRQLFFGAIAGDDVTLIFFKNGTPMALASFTGPNGRKTVPALLDSGASFSVIPAALAAQLGVQPQESGTINTPLSQTGKAQVQYGRLTGLVLAGITIEKVPVQIGFTDIVLVGNDVLTQLNLTVARRAKVVLPPETKDVVDQKFEQLMRTRPADEDWDGLLVRNARLAPKPSVLK